MWKLKQFMPKEPTGLEGRTLDIGNLKVQIQKAIAEGGFSCVYLARDVVHPSKLYALKHMKCMDEESLDLVKKEVAVMKLLKGHPNVVVLHAQSIFDMGRTKEAFLVMEFCEKSLVSVLESRGAGYFEEKQIFLIFRDICNAVFAMHVQSPPIAHRDLKVENVLLGPNGAWKLCDFGSSSTNHKCFDRPEDMGIEEDNIRKHTTPAYRAPEMWDLFRRETISEKVDIWALGCLLYRLCYLKSAFDGESKLQILNGNYRIPDLPRYSSSTTDMIKDMLQGSPDSRPDITQVWFRVNEQLPLELQKETPDCSSSTIAADMHLLNMNTHNEGSPQGKRAPKRTPPPPPTSRELAQNSSPSSLNNKEAQQFKPSQGTAKEIDGSGSLGSFWSNQYSRNPSVSEGSAPVYDEGPKGEATHKLALQNPVNRLHVDSASPLASHNVQAVHQSKIDGQGNSMKKNGKSCENFETSFFPNDKTSCVGSVGISKNEAFNTFVAEFDSTRFSSGNNMTGKETLEAEVGQLKEQLKQANLEKAEIKSKYEKLSAICRSQRQEIQELKQAIAAVTASPSPNKDGSRMHQSSPGSWDTSQQTEIKKGSIWELQEGMITNSSSIPDSKPWKAFADESDVPTSSESNPPRSVRTRNGHQNKKAPINSSADVAWDFGQDAFTAKPTSSRISTSDQYNASQPYSNQVNMEEKHKSLQPAGWAGF